MVTIKLAFWSEKSRGQTYRCWLVSGTRAMYNIFIIDHGYSPHGVAPMCIINMLLAGINNYTFIIA